MNYSPVASRKLFTAHRFYNKLGGGQNHLHNRPEVVFISKPVVAKSLFPTSFFPLTTKCWVGGSGLPHRLLPMEMGWPCLSPPALSKHCFPFVTKKLKILSSALKCTVTALLCTANHSTPFHVIIIYAFLPHYTFLILLVGGWGAHSDIV